MLGRVCGIMRSKQGGRDVKGRLGMGLGEGRRKVAEGARAGLERTML